MNASERHRMFRRVALTVLLTLLLAALWVSAQAGGRVNPNMEEAYRLQRLAQELAKQQAEEILLRHFGGYTIQEADGGWVDGDTVYREYSLVIYLSDTDLAQVHAAADEMIEVFRQSSVLIQANRTATEFYAG